MDGYTFVVEMTKASAWPIGAVVISVVFKTQLRTLLERLETLKTPGVTAVFRAKLEEAEEIAAPRKDAAATALKDPPKIDSWKINLLSYTGYPPEYAFLEAWKRLEEKLRMLEAKRSNGTSFLPPSGLASYLGLPETTQRLIDELKKLRDFIVHDEHLRPSDKEALRYVEMVNTALADIPEA